MDLNRFTEIDGLEVLSRFSKEEVVYNDQGNQLYIDDCRVWMSGGELSGIVSLTIANVLEGKWYVKKPFDVRKEMLERPDSWVGAYQNGFGQWKKVGFDPKKMKANEDILKTTFKPSDCSGFCHEEDLDNCIPIEDVPKEEWQ